MVCGRPSDIGGDECVPLTGPCTADADCCSTLVCTDGECSPNPYDCIPYAGECTTDEECCTGFCDTAAGLCLTPIT